MKGWVLKRLRQKRRLLRREAILCLCALALGLGYSFSRSDAYLPSLDGNVYSMLALEDSLLLVLSNGNRNSLVRVDRNGQLLNYMNTADGQAFQDLESDGETVYAILSYSRDGLVRQQLVTLSLKHASMRTKLLTELTGLPAAPEGVTWREIYLPAADDPAPALKLAGLDRQGRGYLARWDLTSGQASFEKILPEEQILFLKYVSEGHYVWIGRDKRTGQFVNGRRQRDVLAGRSDTPLHISTCGTQCFISDSVNGNIYELFPDGSSSLIRQGTDEIGSSGFSYRQLEFYTSYSGPDGTVQIVGLCAGGAGSVIAGEAWSIRALRPGGLRLLMLWQHGWLASLLLWGLLAVLTEAVYSITHSPRLSVRILLCQILAAAGLLTAVTAVQYRSFRQTIQDEAYQKLRLIGGNLAAAISAGEGAASGGIDDAVDRLEQQISMASAGHENEYAVCVVWNTQYGPVIASDSSIPAGYLLEDVKSREFFSAVSHVLAGGSASLERIQTDTSFDYLYTQSFFLNGRMGCVAVSQSEEDLTAGQSQFLYRLLPILAACPLLFAALAWMTRRLLRPLDEIQRALEEFYTCGGGNLMALEGMPRTELYQVARVFNQLSLQTRTQFNELQGINAAYARLVPDCLLSMLQRRGVTQLCAGDHAPVDGALLVLIPRAFSPDWKSLDRLARLISEPVAAFGGMLVDYDEGLSSFTALFPRTEMARSCALACLEQTEPHALPLMAAVLADTVELGVFGGQSLLYPMAVSAKMRRRLAVLERILDFDAQLVQTIPGPELRLLGWDDGTAFYEDPSCRQAGWQNRWHQASRPWDEALHLFQNGDFSAAMRLFAKVLRLMPEDKSARWYLFRCETLRCGTSQTPETGLLFDWEESGHG